jgi:hypothetical protein
MIIDKYAIIKKQPENPNDIILSINLDNKNTKKHYGLLKINVQDDNNIMFFQGEKQVELDPETDNIFEYNFNLKSDISYSIRYIYSDYFLNLTLEKEFVWQTKAVNFFYSFAAPHRMTIALPDDSNKTLLDVENGTLHLLWTYQNLDYLPYDSFKTPIADWQVDIQPLINEKSFSVNKWERQEGYLPVLKNTYLNKDASVVLECAGGDIAAMIKITIGNTSELKQNIRIICVCPGNWKGYNPAWIDKDFPSDHLLAGWNAPADKVIMLGLGAEKYQINKSTAIDMGWEVNPGEVKTSWIIRPYNKFSRDIDNLRSINWQEKFDKSINAWNELINRAGRIIIPDSGVVNGYYACLTDLFIMREPIGGGYITSIPGTDLYRSAPNTLEPAIVTIALDQAGLHKEAEEGYRINWDLQNADGCWAESGGWAHLMWCASGFKAWALMEHYYHTKDISLLKTLYPQMLASSRWQNEQRKKTKVIIDAEKSVYYGLMPKGMGDGGLLDGDDYYGIFYTHNIWTVYADYLAYLAALILDEQTDARELKEIYETAKNDLQHAMERGAIKDKDGYRWLSGVPGKETGSCWGILNAAFPTNVLSPDHELITGTIKHVEKIMSMGGIPIHTGWMADGMWVAITLDNFAEVHLLRNEGDIANAFLYATLNHGTPLYSWCEERGQEPGSKETSGDRQHLWTPVAVVRFIRDMLIMEDGNTLHLARGIARGWLMSGEPVGIENASTRFGNISYNIRFDSVKSILTGEIYFPEKGERFDAILHCRLNENLKIIKTEIGNILSDASGIIFSECKGYIRFEAEAG